MKRRRNLIGDRGSSRAMLRIGLLRCEPFGPESFDPELMSKAAEAGSLILDFQTTSMHSNRHTTRFI